MQDEVREQLVNLTFPAQQTQRARAVLGPYLLHDAELVSLSSPDPGHRCLALHPRIRDPEQLPEVVRRDCAALGGVWGTEVLGPLTEAQRVRLFTVVFFSRSRPSTALRRGLPQSWRRVLSNFYASTIEVDGAQYATVEHFFQAQKALCSDRPELAQRFLVGAVGEGAVGADPAAAKKAGGRGAYRRFGATLDSACWEGRRIAVMQAALDARWEQDALFCEVLRSTEGMQLLHFERAGARSFWGGSLRRADGLQQGENQLGKMLMALRERIGSRHSEP